MALLISFWDALLHIDQHLITFVQSYGSWVYALLFLIIFLETGIVIAPFLPGDSLLFAVGALAGLGLMNYPFVMVLLVLAAILGDQTNYTIGRMLGSQMFSKRKKHRLLNEEAFDKAHAFFETYGSWSVVLARFLPFLRTLIPFIAGAASMTRRKFLLFNIIGAMLWGVSIVTGGYLFGNVPWVQQNLSLVILGLVLIPSMLFLIGAISAKLKK